MKKRYIIILFIIMFNLIQLQAYTPTSSFCIVKDQAVQLDSCDSYGWCKVSDEEFYIKKQYFRIISKNRFGMIAVCTKDTPTYYYKKRPIFSEEKERNLYDFIVSESPKDKIGIERKNFVYGYVKVDKTTEYEKSLEAKQVQQKVQEQIEIKKTDLKEEATQGEVKVAQKTQEPKEEPKTFIVKKEEAKPTKQIVDSMSRYFIYGDIGVGRVDINKYEDTSISSNIGLGYNFSKEYFSTIGYETIFLPTMMVSTAYVSINKNFSDISLSPYVGAMIGYSKFNVYLNPSDNTEIKDESDSSLSFAVQAGVSKKLDFLDESLKDVSLTGTLQHKFYNLKNSVNNEELKINNQTNAFVGLKYDF